MNKIEFKKEIEYTDVMIGDILLLKPYETGSTYGVKEQIVIATYKNRFISLESGYDITEKYITNFENYDGYDMYDVYQLMKDFIIKIYRNTEIKISDK